MAKRFLISTVISTMRILDSEKYQLRAGDYEDAMDNFYKGGDRSYYSSAFAKSVKKSG